MQQEKKRITKEIVSVMTRTTILVCIAVISSSMNGIMMSIIFITRFNYYAVYYYAFMTCIDCIINIVCLSLQFEYNGVYYVKYCDCCDKWVKNRYIGQITQNTQVLTLTSVSTN